MNSGFLHKLELPPHDMFPEKTKRTEAQTTLLLGLGLSNFAGLLIFCGAKPGTRRFIEATFPLGAFGYYTGDFVLMAGLTLGLLIFPAVLTFQAPRFYCLWGLLPIIIVFLWLAVGFGIAHRLTVFVDPNLALPLLFSFGWAISSFPISLFRWLRRKRNTANQASKPIASCKPNASYLRHYLVRAVTLVTLLSVALIGWHNLKNPKPLHADIRTIFEKGKEARVPLIEKNGGIFVMASLNGQKQLCQIDTGSDTVNWIRDLQIAGEMTSERGQDCDALNNCVAATTVKLPQIQIGSYKMTDVPTNMLDSSSGPFSSVPPSSAEISPLLGNSLFFLTVLTIDYQRKELVIHPSTYDFTKQAHLPKDKILQMGWSSHSNDSLARQQVFGWPVIRVRVSGKSFWCMIDTGWEGPELGITEDFFRRLPLPRQAVQQKTVGHFAYSAGTVRQIDHLRFQAATLSPHTEPLTLDGTGWIVKSLSGGEGIVGTNLMQRYRITLDYERRCVLLEPYAGNTPSKKQENTQRVPKQLGI